MKEDSIAQLVKDLDNEIENARSLLPHERALLKDLRQDIDRLLASSDEQPTGDLLDNLKKTTERFETSHPNLTAAMVQVLDSLTKMGI